MMDWPICGCPMDGASIPFVHRSERMVRCELFIGAELPS